MDWLVEIVAKTEIYERMGEVVYRLVKSMTKGEMGEGERERVYFFIKMGSKEEMGHTRWKIRKCLAIISGKNKSWPVLPGVLRSKYQTKIL